METIINVENARRILGDLISRVNENKQPVIITRRSKEKAVLLDYDEYVRLKTLVEKAKELQLIEALERIQKAVAEAGVPYEAVTEAVREVPSHLKRLPPAEREKLRHLLDNEDSNNENTKAFEREGVFRSAKPEEKERSLRDFLKGISVINGL